MSRPTKHRTPTRQTHDVISAPRNGVSAASSHPASMVRYAGPSRTTAITHSPTSPALFQIPPTPEISAFATGCTGFRHAAFRSLAPSIFPTISTLADTSGRENFTVGKGRAATPLRRLPLRPRTPLDSDRLSDHVVRCTGKIVRGKRYPIATLHTTLSRARERFPILIYDSSTGKRRYKQNTESATNIPHARHRVSLEKNRIFTQPAPDFYMIGLANGSEVILRSF